MKCGILRSVFPRVLFFALISLVLLCLAGCEYWFQDMKGFLEHWTGSVAVTGVEWKASPESQEDDSGRMTISTAATVTASVSIMNPDGYSLNLEPGSGHIGAEGEALKSVRIYGSAGASARSRASITESSSTSMNLELLPISSVSTPESRRLEHTDFTITFVPVRSDSGVDSPHTQSLTLRYNTPPRMPLEVMFSADEQKLTWMGADGWKLVQNTGTALDGYIFWAWPAGIANPIDPDYAALFQVYENGNLVREGAAADFMMTGQGALASLVPAELVAAGYDVYCCPANSGVEVSVYAVDGEGVKSMAAVSGRAPHKIVLDAGDGFFSSNGSQSTNVYKSQGSLVSGSDFEIPTRSGQYLSGWALSAGGDSIRFPYSVDAPVTLHALWAENPPSGESGGGTGSNVPGGGTIATFTITYDANGASSGTIPAAQTKLAGKNMALATNRGGLSKTGYTFAGWNTQRGGQGASYASGASYKTDASVVLYAQWSANSYTVTFDANDGSGDVRTQTFIYDAAQNLQANSFSRHGYHFDGWATQTDGGGASYGDGQNVSNLTADAGGNFTLYAQWRKWNAVAAVTISPPNGTEVDYNETTSITLSTTEAGATIKYTVDGSDPASSTTAKEGATSVTDTVTGAVSIRAIATKANMFDSAEAQISLALKKYTATFNLDGGQFTDSTSTSQEVVSGNSVVEPPTPPVRNGWIFTWWKDPSTGGKYDFTQPVTSSVTLTANWVQKVFVGGTGADDANSGTETDPVATVEKALEKIYAANDGSSSYTISLLADYSGSRSSFSAPGNAVLAVSPAKTLILTITSSGGIYSIDAGRSSSSTGRVLYVDADAKVTLEKVSLKGGYISEGAGAYVAANGTLTLKNGATISDNTASDSGGGVYSLGMVILSGATISGNKATSGDGGGVYVASGATFTATSGTIGGSGSANTASSNGGGIYSAGTVTIGGATVSYNSATNSGGGIHVAGGTSTLSGATISGNKATSGNGGGVYVASGATFTVTSGTIGGSGKENTAGSGGGIYNAGTVNLEGGTVSSNMASSYGAGIYQNGILNMKGAASVTSRLYLPDGKQVNLTGSLTGSVSDLYLSNTNTTSNQVLTGDSSNILSSYGKFTVANSSSYGIDNEGYLRRYVKIDNPSNLQSNITNLLAAASDGDTVTIDLVTQPLHAQTYSGDNRKFLMIIEETSKSLNIVINGNGRTADAFGREDSQGGVLRINAPNSTVTLKDITLKGGHFGDQWGGAIALQSGTLIIEDGTKITENVSWGEHGYGGGICAWETSKIYMRGGEISRNVGSYGGGVCLKGNSYMEISGGKIIDNLAQCHNDDTSIGGRGGGVYVTDQASMKITGGTVNDESTGKSGLWGDCLSDRLYIGIGNYAEASGKVFCQYQPEGSGHQITSTVTSGGSPTVRCHQDKSAYNVTINMQ